MSQKLTRRQFAQMTIASATVATLGYWSNKTLAQVSPSLLYGVKVKSPTLVLNTVDTTTLAIAPLNGLTNGVTLQTGDQLTGFAILSNGNPLVVTTPSRSFKRSDYSPNLIFLGASPQTLTVSGLNQQETILSIAAGNKDLLYALVAQYNGAVPYRLVSINSQTGLATDMSSQLQLPANQVFNNLAFDPSGNLYATQTSSNSNPTLVQLDLKQGQVVSLTPLSFNGQPWINGAASLVVSPVSQFFVLSKPSRYALVNSLYSLNKSTGELNLLTQLDVNQIAFPYPQS